MCNDSTCKDCVITMCQKELGWNAANTVLSTFDSWKLSCPNEDALALGTTIPMFANSLQAELQYFFLLLIYVSYDPLTLAEWGFDK